ncbi:transporter substrate-binding domain-containing protein [Roseivirga sp. BDSF3-8]|uniref:transporter substrate-binding domain-containing protein n=1 Tax=Roseivirga sp. BDSF3-8 TaxID=3241598 RepID=UPI003531B1C4
MQLRYVLPLALFMFIALVPALSFAQEEQDSTLLNRELVIGTKEVAPFVMRKEGDWQGMSIDLWRNIARHMGVTYTFKEYDLPTLIEKVESGELDAAVAAITITEDRERVIDFSFPYYQTGLGIATRSREKSLIESFMAFFNLDFFKAVGALLLVLLVFGLLVWLFERRSNREQFGGSPVKGIAQGLWWSAVTMTTVGYGDKAPVTTGGRIVALVWMFMALIIISSFTAAIASSLTINQMNHLVDGPEDLDNVEVGSVASTSSAAYLQKREINYRRYDNVVEAVDALESGEIDAVVYDAPVLKYILKEKKSEELQVLPQVFNKFYYGIALPQGSPLREKINLVMLENMAKTEWKETIDRYLESDENP